MQGAHEAQLLFRRHPGEDGGPGGQFGQLRVGNLFQVAAGKRGRRIGITAGQPDLTGDGAGGGQVVPRDHLYCDAGLLAPMHGGDRLGSRRVHHALQAEEGEAGRHMTVFQPGMIDLHPAAGEGEHAQSALGHLLHGPVHGRPVQRPQSALIVQRIHAAIEEPLDRPNLVNDPGLKGVMQCGPEHVLGLEGDHVQTGGGLMDGGVEESPLLGGHQQRGLGGIAMHLKTPALQAHEQGIVAKCAGQQALRQRWMRGHLNAGPLQLDAALRLIPLTGHLVESSPGENLPHRHLIFRQRACFIRTDDRGAAESLHDGEFPDDDAAFGHARHADG